MSVPRRRPRKVRLRDDIARLARRAACDHDARWPIAWSSCHCGLHDQKPIEKAFASFTRGRSPTDPDILVPSFNGESIGRWEGDTLVVDTKGFVDDHHWMDQGGASIPASDALRVIERIRMINNGATLEIEYTMTDPKSWEGEWKMSKRWNRVDDTDITEVQCLPDLNDHLPATSSKSLVR